jgi:hypothetical protein
VTLATVFIDTCRLVWEDEHGINCWSVSKHARSLAGTRANIEVTTSKGINITIFQATSASFGKIYMMTSRVSGKKTFTSFIDGVKSAWNESKIIPKHIKKLGPIILIDNASIHSNHSHITVKRLPRYSPFINIAEFINRSHKNMVRKLFRRNLYDGIKYMIENSKHGEKMANKQEYMENIAHLAWNYLDNGLPFKFFNYIKEHYFQDCLNCVPIHN